MNVLSLFDGMSCGQIALKEMGIPVDKYFASEIDKFAIKQTQYNFPNTIQLGDVSKVRANDLPKIDMVIGGSPCQGFSFAGKQLNFEDPRSKLFFEFVRLVKELKPKYFLLENVKMKKEYQYIISKYLGVQPVEINSALVSAQNRKRLYWTNIKVKEVGLFKELYTDIPQPKDRKIYIKDILQPESEIDEKYYINKKFDIGYLGDCVKLDRNLKVKGNQNKASCFTAGGNSGGNHSDMDIFCVASRGRNAENPSDRSKGIALKQRIEKRADKKTNCLTTVGKDNLILQINLSKESNGVQPYQQNRVYDCNGKMVTLTSSLNGRFNIKVPEATKKGFCEVYPGQCVDLSHFNSKTRRGRLMDLKSNTLLSNKTEFYNLTQEFRLRRLTPTECARLQTIPNWYEWVVSDSQQYKMLGNGWTIEVIKHIFSFLHFENK